LHVEIDFSGFPIFADFTEDGTDEPQEGAFVGEEGGDTGPAFEFLVESFEHVAGPEAFAMGGRQTEDGEGFGEVGFDPLREFGG